MSEAVTLGTLKSLVEDFGKLGHIIVGRGREEKHYYDVTEGTVEELLHKHSATERVIILSKENFGMDKYKSYRSSPLDKWEHSPIGRGR